MSVSFYGAVAAMKQETACYRERQKERPPTEMREPSFRAGPCQAINYCGKGKQTNGLEYMS